VNGSFTNPGVVSRRADALGQCFGFFLRSEGAEEYLGRVTAQRLYLAADASPGQCGADTLGGAPREGLRHHPKPCLAGDLRLRESPGQQLLRDGRCAVRIRDGTNPNHVETVIDAGRRFGRWRRYLGG